MKHITSTKSMIKSCWSILRNDKEFLLFPFISLTLCLVLIALFFTPLRNPQWFKFVDHHINGIANRWLTLIWLYLFFILLNFIIISLNAALIRCAALRLNGCKPRVSDGLKTIVDLLPEITGWALVTGTVGFLLRLLELVAREEDSFIGSLIVAILGTFWSIDTFLVTPVLAIEKVGPIKAIRISKKLMQHNFLRAETGNLKLSIFFIILALPSLPPLMLIAEYPIQSAWKFLIPISIGWLIAVSITISALMAIFRVVLYNFIHDGSFPKGFAIANKRHAKI